MGTESFKSWKGVSSTVKEGVWTEIIDKNHPTLFAKDIELFADYF